MARCKMVKSLPLILVSLLQTPVCVLAQSHSIPGAASYVAPAGFPTSAFSSYDYLPSSPTQQPRPAIYDPVLNITFPANLTNPNTIPGKNEDPVYYPEPLANLSANTKRILINGIIADISAIVESNSTASNCSRCIASLTVAKPAALLAPEFVPDAMISLCKKYKLRTNASCEEGFDATTFGATWTQVLALADVSGLDGQYICNSLSSTFCGAPSTLPLNTTGLFPKPKPANATAPPASGKRVKVLHMSDFHLDPRYSVGSEANCSAGMCCRTNVHNAVSSAQVVLPAPLYGTFKCDTPYDLGLAALQAVGPLTGTNKSNPLAFSIYTGDLVAHDPQSQRSRAYVEYTETSIFNMFKSYITGPVFPALGNHDTSPDNIDAPHSLPGALGKQMSWNYDHLAGLWQHEGWLNATDAAEARLHYGGYSVKPHHGLRIIAFNTDFWYRNNILNFINTANPDNSGMFGWMIAELQAAEDCGERVWIVGHVLSGWDGSNPMPNPTDLFYQIVDRYSPHVIANIFWGHTHEDQFTIYYANNGTARTGATALATAWIGPSVAPMTNLNSGFRLYEVDTGNFDVYNAWTYVADVSSFDRLDGNTTGPTFRLEYDTRCTYGRAAAWPASAPLNATFWHAVTEAMENNTALASTFNTLQGKSSVRAPNCTSEACARAKVCYMRSGSVALGRQCPQGYGSVQSPFKPSS